MFTNQHSPEPEPAKDSWEVAWDRDIAKLGQLCEILTERTGMAWQLRTSVIQKYPPKTIECGRYRLEFESPESLRDRGRHTAKGFIWDHLFEQWEVLFMHETHQVKLTKSAKAIADQLYRQGYMAKLEEQWIRIVNRREKYIEDAEEAGETLEAMEFRGKGQGFDEVKTLHKEGRARLEIGHLDLIACSKFSNPHVFEVSLTVNADQLKRMLEVL